MNKPKYIKCISDGWCGELNEEEDCYYSIGILFSTNNGYGIGDNEGLESDLVTDTDYVKITKEEFNEETKKILMQELNQEKEGLLEKYIKKMKELNNTEMLVKEYFNK